MIKKSALLAAVAIGAGTLFVATPAQASGCGNTQVTDTSLQGWTFGLPDTRAAGTVEFEADHLAVAVSEQSSAGKATGTYVIGNGVPLKDQTAQSNYGILTDLGEDKYVQGFSYQLQIDSDGDGDRDEYLVYEPDFYGVGNWHSNVVVNGVYQFIGDLDVYSQANPKARILAFGFTLGSGVPPVSTEVDRVTFGCNTFTFQELAAANQAPTAAFTYSNTPGSLSVLFDGSTSTDPENGALTYSWQFGDSSLGSGATPSHEYKAAGTYEVSLVVTDDKGVQSPAVTQSVTVTAPTPPPATDTKATTFLPSTGAETAGWLTVGATFLMAGIGWTLFGKRRKAAAAA